MPSDPTTEAGKRLVAKLDQISRMPYANISFPFADEDVAEVEAEARAALLDELRAEVEGLDLTERATCWCDAASDWIENGRCQVCGHDMNDHPTATSCSATVNTIIQAIAVQAAVLALLDDHKKGAAR